MNLLSAVCVKSDAHFESITAIKFQIVSIILDIRSKINTFCRIFTQDFRHFAFNMTDNFYKIAFHRIRASFSPWHGTQKKNPRRNPPRVFLVNCQRLVKRDRNSWVRGFCGLPNTSSEVPSSQITPSAMNTTWLDTSRAKGHLMGYHDHGKAFLCQLAHNREHLPYHLGVQCRGGLIKEQHLWLPWQGHAQWRHAASYRPRAAGDGHLHREPFPPSPGSAWQWPEPPPASCPAP